MVLALACVGAVPRPVDGGQGGKFKWWQSERFVQELGLTREQSARIEEVFQNSWPALHAAKADLDRLETELSQMIAEGTASEAKVLQQIDRVEASRSAMGRTRSLIGLRHDLHPRPFEGSCDGKCRIRGAIVDHDHFEGRPRLREYGP